MEHQRLVVWTMVGVAIICFAGLLPTLFSASSPIPKVIVEWRFRSGESAWNWRPNQAIADVKVTDEGVLFRTVSDDPIWELSDLLDIPASPWQVVEVQLKSDREGEAELFWSNTTDPPYGGFRPHKRTPFWVAGDRQWHTYRILPFWHPEGKIVRLRFDPFGFAQFTLAAIRIVELPAAQMTPATGEVRDWLLVGEGTVQPTARGWVVSLHSPDALLLTPTSIASEQRPFLSVRMAVSAGKRATLFFASNQAHGLHARSVPIIADGREHTYTLDMIDSSGWSGQIIAVGLRPTDAVGAKAIVREVRFDPIPKGAPELQVVTFALDDATPRVGVATEVFAIVRHVGGDPARNLQAILQVPKGVELLSAPSLVPHLAFGEEAEFRWRLRARAPIKGEARLTVRATNAKPVTARTTLDFSPLLTTTKAAYVPPPQPVRGKYEVGVYYFPGWKSWGQWLPILSFPERKPVLGWYREGDPEVADWHIKWAVEHGITFFVYDWYWVQGARMLEHALHDGYLRSRYRSLLKFCLLWANHNPPKTSSLEDCLALTRHWLAHYFRLPEYFTVDGKPLVIIFSPYRLREDLGSDEVRKALEAMRQECVQHGLPGLYIAACVGSVGEAVRAAAEGYDAVTAYNWPTLGMRSGERWSPFEMLVDAYRQRWESIVQQGTLPLIVPISGGWDSRPWHGEEAVVRFGRTPQNFRRHLQDAKAFLDKFVPQGKALPIALVEAWNEWGEGSYIEPHAEFGFGYLDAIRSVFTDAPEDHADLAPVDVGLGPYEVARLPLDRREWTFERDEEGWDSWMGMSEVRAEQGRLVGRTVSNDPAFFGPPIRVRASEVSIVVVRMRLTKLSDKANKQPTTDIAQFFWRTVTSPESEANSLRFPVQLDGQWHEYRLPVAQNPRWRGLITRLRLDPSTQRDVLVEVDFLRLTAP